MKYFCSVILFFLLISISQAQSTVFIVRHAEKAISGGDDPELSEAGRARADALATALKDSGITAIYATEFKRTQNTAAPLAKLLGIKVATHSSKEMLALASELRRQNANALVVGHSNTIPELIRAFGIDSPIKIADNDYDNLFLIVMDEKPRLIRLHYR
jgi:broad specificity phosphatase PhoE